MKKVLIVANDFPPIGGAGVQRAFYLAKHLPELGWSVDVLTVKDVAFPVKDASALSSLPESVRIHRTGSLEFRRLIWVLSRLRSVRTSGNSADPDRPVAADLSRRARELGRHLRSWLTVPDDRIGWLPFAAARAWRLGRREKYACVIATVPPYSSGLIGSWIARMLRVPFMLDLRDPWNADPYAYHATRFHARLDAAIEGSVYRSATAITVVAPVFRERLLRRYPDVPQERVSVVFNGFDLDLFRQPPPPAARGSIAYVGSFYAHHEEVVRRFFEGWREAAARHPAVGTLRFDVFGRCDPEIHAVFREYAESVETVYHGYVSHEDAVRALRAAAGCVFFIKELDPASAVVSIPGKLFEILAARRPVLLVSPPGDAADLVTARDGTWCRNSDTAGIADWLGRVASGCVPPAFLEESFTREAIARNFAGILDKICAG